MKPNSQQSTYYTFRNKKLGARFTHLLSSIDEISNKRKEIISTHIGELYLLNMKDVQDIDGRIHELIGKNINHPTVYLASTLGFNKLTWNKNVEAILEPFGLGQKLKYPSYENAIKFEKLKLLILKYLELEKKNE
ncbi:hypothetical protein TCON_0311 [Astathelohania contejeani]|uniref:Uncharacterized protein n=1 Tax=Astathelohania contejeani TaxID=164912 RepID=A0ABQ7I253_9MICR|nr:hypothetical protein TCON_0311 [Thelohania contejeani]